MSKLRDAILLLVADAPLPERYRDHPLRGNWKGYRDAHIEPDWLLIYRIVGDELHLVRTGSHADLFDE
jgi:mRNA interferase YafQ